MVNFVFMFFLFNCFKKNIAFIYKMAAGSFCLNPNRYTYVKWPGTYVIG